jgi:hypothetical protein
MPARVAGVIAAELGVEPHLLQTLHQRRFQPAVPRIGTCLFGGGPHLCRDYLEARAEGIAELECLAVHKEIPTDVVMRVPEILALTILAAADEITIVEAKPGPEVPILIRIAEVAPTK